MEMRAPLSRWKCLVSGNRACVLLAALLVLAGCVFFWTTATSAERKQGEPERETAREIVRELMGSPYQRSPLGEGRNETIYREDVFDCTTFVLTVAARMNALHTSASRMMRRIHYYPPGEVSFENRLHFSTYRNRVSDYFADITSEVGGRLVKRSRVVLNRDRPGQGRLVCIDWQREVTVEYIPSADVPRIVDELPDVAGVGFVRREYFQEGLGVVHEGIVLDGRSLAHASSRQGRVVKVSFLDYLSGHDYTGVCFYKLRTFAAEKEEMPR